MIPKYCLNQTGAVVCGDPGFVGVSRGVQCVREVQIHSSLR